MPDCTTVDLPVVTADFCAPDINFGEVDKIYFTNDGSPLTDWADLAEWNTRLDNADVTADNDKIRSLHVIGDKPRPEKSVVEFSQGRKAYPDPDHTINIRVDETGADNYGLLLFLEANAGSQLRVWYQAGKYLYGGNTGILANLNMDDVIPESDAELNTFVGEVTWEGPHPTRIANPMA